MSQLGLQDIIQVYPNLEHHCAGFAPSKGRRCRYPTNADNRARACALLAKGTKKLHAGQPVDALLEELAPLVLCLRYHQYQAPGLVARWKEDIHSFRMSQQAQHRRQMSRQYTSPYSGDLDELQEQYEGLAERVAIVLDNLHRIQGHLHAQESRVRFGSGGDNSHLATRLDLAQEIITNSRRRLNRILDDERSPPRLATQQTESTQQDGEEPHQTATETDPEQREDRSRSSHSPGSSTSSTRTSPSPTTAANPPTPAITSTTTARRSVLRISHSPSRDNTITARPRGGISRRSVERDHDCGICLDALLVNSNNSDDDSDSDSDASSGEKEEAVDLTWCKARCGNNFHSECLRQWINSCKTSGRDPTCPTCRTRWVD
ncbi:hypothetical protein VTN96DRAFT_2860 [Rasamsonia emersonii]|uniref:RING-type domain-containing protein n=1 Tax=Rasamsonia emersonii (strain ATCC 16479 / CBS 393.64 / IMI 116815) TaxID=1408163 RepID=A0A0F4Z632_RASE3|nr:hypothetical protein T310_0645 [Rasamsonia emersonii CBS 393.64]KKA25328.1 hypothetical protein T310_0645 [Rasamsonia emersonii CBS 393.64]